MTGGKRNVSIIGAGPAGCAAALAALAEGASVTLYEKSRFPRHKVCGEFLAPEILPVIASLGVEPAFRAAKPARLVTAMLCGGGDSKPLHFAEPAYSLSRYSFDNLLLEEALRHGAELKMESKRPDPAETTIVAHGRQLAAPKGGRLFAFKAHFEGSMGDVGELHFFRGGYIGVTPVENGAVNVAGLAPEELLRAHRFHPEELFSAEIRTRLRPMRQSFDWLMTGPLVFHSKFASDSAVYLAGDAMGFVDPFTGSGILSAMMTGRLAGKAAARGVPVDAYNAECRKILRRQYGISSLVRGALGANFTFGLIRRIPVSLLYRLTRPRVTVSP